MAHDVEDDREDRETGPTYKSLFLGACALISLAFGWWFTGFISAYEQLAARVALFDIREKEYEWTFRINGQKITALDERITRLEREHEQHNRDTKKEGGP